MASGPFVSTWSTSLRLRCCGIEAGRSFVEADCMQDFWLSCGHHLLDRDDGGGLLVTDEFLKAYLARPELAPPPNACAAERGLHAALLEAPRRPVTSADVAAIADPDARENWS